MNRFFVLVALVFMLVSCGATSKDVSHLGTTPAPISSVAPIQPLVPAESLNERRETCSFLLNHLIDVSVAFYVKEHELKPNPEERRTLKVVVAATLRKRGVLPKFFSHCLGEMNRDQIACAMKAATFDEMDRCEPDEPAESTKSPDTNIE